MYLCELLKRLVGVLPLFYLLCEVDDFLQQQYQGRHLQCENGWLMATLGKALHKATLILIQAKRQWARAWSQADPFAAGAVDVEAIVVA